MGRFSLPLRKRYRFYLQPGALVELKLGKLLPRQGFHTARANYIVTKVRKDGSCKVRADMQSIPGITYEECCKHPADVFKATSLVIATFASAIQAMAISRGSKEQTTAMT